MIKFQLIQALTSHFESFWSIVRFENVYYPTFDRCFDPTLQFSLLIN